MSYTSSQQVRSHLVAHQPVAQAVLNQSLVLSGADWISFYSGPVAADSLVVKGRRSGHVHRTVVTLDETPVSFGTSHLENGSVVVASDSSLGTVYVENRDFVIDYQRGEIVAKPEGDLSAGQLVTIWFAAFHPYTVEQDYRVDAEHGQVRRVPSGAIADNETVVIDYTPVYQSFTEQIVDNAVTEANGVVERLVDPSREFGADPTLSLAATYRALAIICRTAATRSLSLGHGSDRVALAWLRLAEDYADRADTFLADFRPPPTGPKPPTLS
ncbi:hypothetical protein GF420_07850 [candidate division GN15 bacterium]|nr:hypothetical protein [candidate division GN15 bacterium]